MIRRGLWSPDEDEKLRRGIAKYENGSWNDIAQKAGLQRCGRSCRQRWLNHLRPGLRKDKFSEYEMKQVMELQSKLGNRWSVIAAQMQGRTDNEVKNLWNTVIKRGRLPMLSKASQSASYLLPLADSPSQDTASSQSASSSHSSWNLHASPGLADVDLCSSLASHDLMDVELSEQLLTINGQDLPHAPIINGKDAVHLDQYAASGSSSLICAPPAFESSNCLPGVSSRLLIPPLSPCLDPADWEYSIAKLVDATLSNTPTPLCKRLTSHSNIKESAPLHTSKTSCSNSLSFIPSHKSSLLACNTIPSFQKGECVNTLEPPPIFENGRCLASLLLPQQFKSRGDNDSSQDHCPTPCPIIIMNHEDRSYTLNLDVSNEACDGLNPTSSILETSFQHHFEYGTQDIITSLLWNGGCHE